MTPAVSCCIPCTQCGSPHSLQRQTLPPLPSGWGVAVLSSFYQGIAAGACSPGREDDGESCTFNWKEMCIAPLQSSVVASEWANLSAEPGAQCMRAEFCSEHCTTSRINFLKDSFFNFIVIPEICKREESFYLCEPWVAVQRDASMGLSNLPRLFLNSSQALSAKVRETF